MREGKFLAPIRVRRRRTPHLARKGEGDTGDVVRSVVANTHSLWRRPSASCRPGLEHTDEQSLPLRGSRLYGKSPNSLFLVDSR